MGPSMAGLDGPEAEAGFFEFRGSETLRVSFVTLGKLGLQ